MNKADPPFDYNETISPQEDQDFQLGMWFVHMRWIACGTSAGMICLFVWVLGYLPKAVFPPLAILVACLAATNILFRQCVLRNWLGRYLEEIQIGSDLFLLTAMLHYSGGIENPAMLAYVFHVIISGILLNRKKCYATVVLATALFGAMTLAEMVHILPHYTLEVFPHAVEEHGLFHAAHEPIYVMSVMILQAVLMSLTAYFTTTIMTRLRVEQRRAMFGRQRLHRVLQATGAGFAIYDQALRPVWLNDQIKKWLNLSDRIIGHRTRKFDRWVGKPSAPAAETFRDGQLRVVERQATDAQGEKRLFQVTVAPLLNASGEVYQVVELTQDITWRKRMDAEMMHSAKMAALGFLAAGIAHEVGNPLASIAVRLDLLEDNQDQAFLTESLQLLRKQIDRIARTIQDVSQFARRGEDDLETCQLNEVVGETLKMLRFHERTKRRRIQVELADALPATRMDRDQLAQVFLNLGLNALEAMDPEGILTIRTSKRGDEIFVEFADTGKGIDSEIRNRIFDPFFTTKDAGLGLGLSITRDLVQANGGRIDVESTEGHGSVFRVVLPIRTAREPSPQERKAEQQ